MSDGIVLVGLPGSGKTVVGRQVAERLGRPFIDIDCETERLAGAPPALLIERDGEARMRAVERRAVESAVRVAGAVIATGGGTVLDPMNRWLLMEHGVRVRLDAPPETLAARLRADGTPRPLLGNDLEAGLRRTGQERADVYAAVDGVVDASASRASVAGAVMDTVAHPRGPWRRLFDARFARHVPTGPGTGRLVMGRGFDDTALLDGLAGAASGTPVFVADRLALASSPRLGRAIAVHRLLVLDGGEQAKSFAELASLLGRLSSMNVERADPLVVVGGGTIGDLGGLAAALHRRGIPLVNVPTTWLAQADSAIGGKVAIDLPAAKNAVGAFWPAWLTFVDADLPGSLPVERRRDGLAECLKAGLIGDPDLWRLVEDRGAAALSGGDRAAAYAITERAVRVKLAIVDRDPFETGERRKLNLGHTIGHALEIESGYSLAHGAAVALGLRAVARIAAGRGAQADLAERVDAVLATLGFDLRWNFDRAAVISATHTDKKREGDRQRWILPMAVGEVAEVDDVTADEIGDALDAISA